MTRAQIRELLRRNLQDSPKVEWPDDAELDLLIEQAYLLMQKEVVKVDREAHPIWDYMNLTIDVSWYPLPPTLGVLHVALLDESTNQYKILTRKSYRGLQEFMSSTTGATSKSYYARRGQWIFLAPAPTKTITNGIELVHAGLRALSGDTDVPRLKEPSHMALVYWAKMLALGETDEATGETRNRLAEITGDLANWYEVPGDDPDAFQVEVAQRPRKGEF